MRDTAIGSRAQGPLATVLRVAYTVPISHSPNMAIEAVIFDFGGVIIPGSPMSDVQPSPYGLVEQQFGLEHGALYRAMYLDNPVWLKLRVGEGTSDIWHASVREALLELTDAPTAQKVLGMLTKKDPAEFNEGMITLIKRLRRRYKVGLLSNAAPGLEDDLINHYQIYGLFNDVINSATVRLAKPDPKIFALAASRLRVPIDHYFFTDDLLHNVEAARTAGMTAYQFDNCVGLTAALEAAGVRTR
ncbi:MAG: HAD family phosphatase [Tepidiformaceae bacterium]